MAKKVEVYLTFTVPDDANDEGAILGFMDDAISDACKTENEDQQIPGSEHWHISNAGILPPIPGDEDEDCEDCQTSGGCVCNEGNR